MIKNPFENHDVSCEPNNESRYQQKTPDVIQYNLLLIHRGCYGQANLSTDLMVQNKQEV